MPCCAVSGCTNHTRHSKISGISFHRFPANKITRKQWLHACKRADNFCISNARVCSVHFAEEDYVRDIKAELLNLKSRRKLKYTSVPSIKMPNSVFANNNSGRQERAVKRNIIKEINCLMNENGCNNQNESEYDLSLLSPGQGSCNSFQIKPSNFELESMKENEHLKEINKQILCEMETLKSENFRLKEVLKQYESYFSISQRNAILKGKCPAWNNEDISRAIALRCISKKAFKYIKDEYNYPLPSESTLKRRLQHCIIKPGFIDLSLSVLKAQGEAFTDMEKDIAISFDEMKVKADLCYDPVQDKILGPHTAVQVVMIRGLIGKWKQPIYYEFDKPVDKDLFMNIVKTIEFTGFRVRAFVSDMGPTNQKLLSNLGIKPGCTSLKNPFCENRNIWAFCDVPHTLKLLRNHLLDKGYQLPDGKTVKKQTFEKLIEKQKDGDLKFAYKINNDHLLLTNTERQNVRKAAELLSDSVASAIQYVLPGNSHVVEFIRTVNDGFDVLNSRMPYHRTNKLKCAYGTNLNEQNVALNKLHDLCESIRVIGKNKLLPFQKGFLISIRSIQGLYTELQAENYTYLMAARCNQDVLESFFSFLRGFGKFYDHPLPTAVSQRIKFLLLSRSSKTIITNGNCCEEETITLSADVVKNLESENLNETDDQSTISSVEEDVTEDHLLLEDYESENKNNDSRNPLLAENPDLIKMLAGYISYRVKKKSLSTVIEYGNPTNQLPTQNKDWLSSISKGLLMEPTKEWLEIVFKMEEEFNKFHGKDLVKECGVMSMLTNTIKSSFSQIDDFAITCYVRTRTFIRMKSLNKKKSQKRLHYESTNCDKSRKISKKLVKLK